MSKQKSLQLKDVKVGLSVVVSEYAETYVYTIKELAKEGRLVHLVYPTANGESSGGWVDYSICMVPTAEQLANSETST